MLAVTLVFGVMLMALALIVVVLGRMLSKKNSKPSFYFVDEVGTLYIFPRDSTCKHD